MIVTVSKDEMSKLGVFTCLGLKAEHGSGFYLSFCRFVQIVLHHVEDKPAYFREKLSVMLKEHTEHFGQGEGYQSVGKPE